MRGSCSCGRPWEGAERIGVPSLVFTHLPVSFLVTFLQLGAAMAAAQTAPHPLPPPVATAPSASPTEGPNQAAIEQALAPVRQPGGEAAGAEFGGAVARLPVELDVAIPVRDFRVRNLLALKPGEVIESQWTSGEDLPLAAGEVQLAWSEFEVIESEMAVRITRLA